MLTLHLGQVIRIYYDYMLKFKLQENTDSNNKNAGWTCKLQFIRQGKKNPTESTNYKKSVRTYNF